MIRNRLIILTFASILSLSTFGVCRQTLPIGEDQTSRYDFFIQGTKVGSSTMESASNGNFVSQAKLEIGPTKISSTVKGFIKDHQISNFDLAMKVSNTDVSFSWDGKKIQVSKPAKDTITYDGKAIAFYSNYQPGLISNLSEALSKSESKTQKGQVFVLESANPVEGELSDAGLQSYTINGQSKSCRHFKLTIASVDIDIYQTSDGTLIGESVASQHFQILKEGVTGLFVDPLAKFKELSQPIYQTKTVTNLICKMRDGTKLATSAIMPDKPGKYPVILLRTPYGRGLLLFGGEMYAKRGYIFVVQDVRGTGDSGGKWDPFMNETKDGYDAVEWASHQPWSNGKVGMIGASYSGYVQWAAAVEKPPALKCIIPQVSPPDAMTNIPYEFGAFTLLPNLWWLNIAGTRHANLANETMPAKDPKAILSLPLSTIPEKMYGHKMPLFTKWLSRTGYDDFKGFDYEKDILNVKIPALNISGWWDGDGIGTDLNWLAMRRAKRQNMWLIEGPWTHSFDTTDELGNDKYGPNAIIELDPLYLRWFDHWLKGKQVGLNKVPKVQYFVMTENKWHKTSDFPDPVSQRKSLYLGAHGKLSSNKSTGYDTYIYNPAMVTVPKELSGNLTAQPKSIFLRFDDPTDHVTFLSVPFKKKTNITGPFSVDVYVKVNTKSTDLYAFLFVQDKNGNRMPIGIDGKLNLSYLRGLNKPHNIVPGHIYLAHIFPWLSAREIRPGERIGLVIISQTFPATSRNLNTGEPILTGTKMKVAHVTILHDRKYPSSISYYSMAGS